MEYILSIGINDYRNCSGGTNKVILAHQKMFRENGYGYIYLCPLNKKNNDKWKVIINNQFKGVKKTQYLDSFLYSISNYNICIREVHIHHLLNASLDEVDKLLIKFDVDIKFYLHDFFSICPSVKLLKNNISFCGGEKMSREKCGDCTYYENGNHQNMLLRQFIKKYEKKIIFIAPSEVARDLWLKSFEKYRDKVIVIEHQKLIGIYDGNRELIKDKIKVGYLGEQSDSKGWNVWKHIIKYIKDDRFEYYYFGKSKSRIKKVTNVKVDFRKDIDAMIKSLRRKTVDCVILWSIWEETYSYTYYESLASNVFVITNRLSGNIAKQVKKRKNGIVLNNEEELIELFENYDLLSKKINEYKMYIASGAEKLVENDEVISYIKSNSLIDIQKNEKNKITLEEILYTLFYGLLETIYFIKRRLI